MIKSHYGNFWIQPKNHVMENHTMENHVIQGITVVDFLLVIHQNNKLEIDTFWK